MGTPGMRLIQDLLAKSVAKWSGDGVVKTDKLGKVEFNQTEPHNDLKIEPSDGESSRKQDEQDKRKRGKNVDQRKKKVRRVHCIKTVFVEHKDVKKDRKTLKAEYTETETKTVVDIEHIKQEESVIMRLLKTSIVKYSDNLDQSEKEIIHLKSETDNYIPKTEDLAVTENTMLGAGNSNNREIHKEVQDEIDVCGPIQHDNADLNSVNGKRGTHNITMNKKEGFKNKVRSSRVKYSPEEDDIIISAIETFGDNLDITSLAKQTGRKAGSVYNRVKKLKSGIKFRVQRQFSLLEDQVILDTVLPGLSSHTLKELPLHGGRETDRIAAGLDRLGQQLISRWSTQLNPWIIQHYSGTLNLDIRRMLANHVNETYGSIDSIDWTLVAEKPEFVGHTERSLRHKFFGSLIENAVRHEKIGNTEVTLNKIAENANEYFSEENSRKVTGKVLTRQKQVIDYFEQFVKRHEIINFL